MAVRDRVQRLALRYRYYGYRPITRLLKREGWVVNHKRVLRLMREDNLLSLRRRKFVITTDSAHNWQVYPTWRDGCKSAESISCGSPTSPTCDCNRNSSIWR